MTEPVAAPRWVFDTNVLVSAAFWPASPPGVALALAVKSGCILRFNGGTLAELNEVMMRPKFDRYALAADRRHFIADLMPLIEIVPPSAPIRACRDPKDDKFLEAAVHGGAQALVSGDADLLALHPFLGVAILRPADFIALLAIRDAGPQANEPAARYTVRKKQKVVAALRP